MDYTGTSNNYFSPTSNTTTSFDHRTEEEANPAPIFTPRIPSYPSYATSLTSCPPSLPVETPGPNAGQRFSFFSGVQPMNFSATPFTWDGTFSGPMILQSAPYSSLPDELSAYQNSQQISSLNFIANSTQTVALPTPAHEQYDGIRQITTATGTVSASTDEQGDQLPGSQLEPHVTLWHQLCSRAVIVNGPRMFVPQTIYQPYFRGDKERYVSHAQLHDPIIFCVQNSPEWGVPIPHLLTCSVSLVDGDEPAFASCGPSIGIRVQWPGYQPFHKQVPTRDYTPERRVITKARLAKIVARSVKQFMDTMSQQTMEAGADAQWRVGRFNITVDNIILVSLHHVSQGSWQPQLRLSRIRN